MDITVSVTVVKVSVSDECHCDVCTMLLLSETCLNLDLNDIAHGRYKNVTYTKYAAHNKEWTRSGKIKNQPIFVTRCS